MRSGRSGLNAYDVIDSNKLERDFSEKPDPLSRIPLKQTSHRRMAKVTPDDRESDGRGTAGLVPRSPSAAAHLLGHCRWLACGAEHDGDRLFQGTKTFGRTLASGRCRCRYVPQVPITNPLGRHDAQPSPYLLVCNLSACLISPTDSARFVSSKVNRKIKSRATAAELAADCHDASHRQQVSGLTDCGYLG
jgi:hypothetical protein